MRSRLLTMLGALVLAIGGLLAVSASPAVASDPPHCSGWNKHPDLYNRGGIGFQSTTLLLSGPFEDCSIVGRGHTGEGINVHCKVVTNRERWYYVVDTTNGDAGWASRPNLVFNTNNLVDDCPPQT
jgi:hypothetical protein